MKKSLLIAMLLAGTALASLSARADVVLDQQFTTTDGGIAGFSLSFGGFRRAETFTVGVTGILSQINIFLYINTSTNFTGMNILPLVDGFLFTTAVPLTVASLQSITGNVATFTLSLPVVAGEVLAMEPLAPDGGVGWLSSHERNCNIFHNGSICEPIYPDGYLGGEDYFYNPDLNLGRTFIQSGRVEDFQTFVTSVPAPTIGTGLPALALITIMLAYKVLRPRNGVQT